MGGCSLLFSSSTPDKRCRCSIAAGVWCSLVDGFAGCDCSAHMLPCCPRAVVVSRQMPAQYMAYLLYWSQPSETQEAAVQGSFVHVRLSGLYRTDIAFVHALLVSNVKLCLPVSRCVSQGSSPRACWTLPEQLFGVLYMSRILCKTVTFAYFVHHFLPVMLLHWPTRLHIWHCCCWACTTATAAAHGFSHLQLSLTCFLCCTHHIAAICHLCICTTCPA